MQRKKIFLPLHSNNNKGGNTLETDNILEMLDISKAFAGNIAIDKIKFCVKKGEVHGLAGQNGAGKSTLIKILTGIYQKDKGSIFFEGKEINPRNPREAQKVGISTIYQELSLVPNLSIAENICIGNELYSKRIIKWKTIYDCAKDIINGIGIKVNVKDITSEQSVAIQQMIAIARAVSFDAKLIVMDEPTSSLEDTEVRVLLHIINDLKARGISFVFITHKLDEMFQICDRITILRDGRQVGTYLVEEINKSDLILKMIGKTEKEFSQINKRNKNTISSVDKKTDNILEVSELSLKNKLNDITFTMNRSEVLGIAGLLGAGKSEIAMSIFGAYSNYNGEVYLNGKKLEKKSPAYSISKGIGLVSEDRKVYGILPKMSVKENISILLLPRISKFGFINRKKEKEIVKAFVKKLGIKIASLDQDVRTLSGGNQQKVLLARWLCIQPELLILDEPTRGIDVGAKLDVQTLIMDMTKEGVSILMISSENDELSRSCNRIIVMHEGNIIHFIDANEVTEDNILAAIANKK